MSYHFLFWTNILEDLCVIKMNFTVRKEKLLIVFVSEKDLIFMDSSLRKFFNSLINLYCLRLHGIRKKWIIILNHLKLLRMYQIHMNELFICAHLNPLKTNADKRNLSNTRKQIFNSKETRKNGSLPGKNKLSQGL